MCHYKNVLQRLEFLAFTLTVQENFHMDRVLVCELMPAHPFTFTMWLYIVAPDMVAWLQEEYIKGA